eukprot:8044700-Pyramimonas_sp.AAC.1
MNEARALDFPLRLMWMIIQTYLCPRTIRAFNNISNLFVAHQGILAGCTHVTTVLMVVLYRVVDS